MNYREIKDLLEGVANRLDVTVQFEHGRRADFNVQDIKYPAILLAPPRLTTNFTSNALQMNDTFSVTMSFFTMSKTDALLPALMDDISLTDKIRRKYLVELNNEDNVSLSGITTDPFFKVGDDCLTGLQVTMSISVPDNYRYCA